MNAVPAATWVPKVGWNVSEKRTVVRILIKRRVFGTAENMSRLTTAFITNKQVSAVADNAASRKTCCKQRWMLDMINLQRN